jgi:hypothetical protein
VVSHTPPQVDPGCGAGPYRSGATPPGGAVERGARAEGPLLAMLLVFWVVSVVRVTGAIAMHEPFGAEATLALLAAVGIPWSAWRAYRSGRAPVRSGSPASPGSR